MKLKDKITFAIVIIIAFIIPLISSTLADNDIISKATLAAISTFSMAAALIYSIYFISKTISTNKKNRRSHLDKYGAIMNAILKHISGLPIAMNLPVEVFYCPDKIVFKKDVQEFTINLDKVTAIDVTTGRDTGRKALTGAAAGKYVAGGATGAALGALSSIETLLIISYVSDGKNKSIVLDASTGGTFPAKLAKIFNQNRSQKKTTIEL